MHVTFRWRKNIFLIQLRYFHLDNFEVSLYHRAAISVQVFWARLASFGQCRLISDPQISSKLQHRINDPKGLENKICTMMKARENFYGDYIVPIINPGRFGPILIRPASFRPKFWGESFRPSWGGSFRPNFKVWSFRSDFRVDSFRPDLFIWGKQVKY